MRPMGRPQSLSSKQGLPTSIPTCTGASLTDDSSADWKKVGILGPADWSVAVVDW